jgi:hypothetical protein
MKFSVKDEDRCSSETHPVESGMLCDGMSAVNSRLLSRMSEAVLRSRVAGECGVGTSTPHPCGCPREAVP